MIKLIKKIALILTSATMFVMMPLTAFAANYEQYEQTVSTKNSYTTYLDDGSYYTTAIGSNNTSILSAVSAASTTSITSVTQTKTVTYYNADGVMLWRFTLKGTFIYNGTTSKCTSASSTVNIYGSGWYIDSKSASASGNKAIGSVTMKRKLLGVVTSTKTVNATLTCDKNGNIY